MAPAATYPITHRYFHLSVEQFEQSFNPGNAELIVMERRENTDTGEQWYVLNEECAKSLNMGLHIPAVKNDHASSTPGNVLPLGGSFDSHKTSYDDSIFQHSLSGYQGMD